MSSLNRFSAVPALAAAFSLLAAPAAAADLPLSTSRSAIAADMAWDASEDEVYERHRSYRRYRHRHHRVDAGDVLAGVVILGGIAAIASAVKRSERNDRYRDRDYRYRERDDRYRDSRYRSEGASGIDRAVSNCLSRIERDVRVETVDAVERRGDGWLVSGSLYNGEGFSCSIDRSGRISDVDFSGSRDRGEEGEYRYEARDDRQWDDARYRAAWADVENDGPAPTPPTAPAPDSEERRPAYPGGPIDGDLDEDDIGTGYRGAN